MSPMAVNSVIGSLVAVFGVVLVAPYGRIRHAGGPHPAPPLMLPWNREFRDEIGFNMALGIIPSLCAIVTFIFGLTDGRPWTTDG